MDLGADAEGEMRNHCEITTPNDLLEALGRYNPYLIFITASMSLIWGLTAMPIMISAFVVDGIACSANDTACMAEREQMITITDEFHIHDTSALSPEWFSSAFWIGNIFGGPMFAYLADRIGRKIIVIPSLFLLGLFSIPSLFVNSFALVLATRFCQGFFFTASSFVVWTLASECISLRTHAFASMMFGLSWVVGYCAVAPVAYFVHSWRWVSFVAGMPCVLFAFIFWVIYPESLCFLIERGKREEVQKWVRRAERPGRPIVYDVDKVISHRMDDEVVPTEDFGLDNGHDKFLPFLAHNRIYIMYLAVAAYMWIADYLVYNGMSLFSTTLVGNPYLNYILSGLVEIPAYLFTPELLNRCGRRMTVIISHLCTGVLLLSLYFTPQDLTGLYVTIWLCGKLAVSMSFICLMVYASEIFPTAVRNSCIGICSIFSNLGAVIAPHVRLLALIHPALPVILFGSVSVISAGTTLLLPETNHPHTQY